MNELRIFNNPEFGEVRTVTIDGEYWFVGNDVAKALGYQKPDQAVRTNVDEEDSTLMGVLDSNNHTQQMKFGIKSKSCKDLKRHFIANRNRMSFLPNMLSIRL